MRRWNILFKKPEGLHIDWGIVEEALSSYTLVGQTPPLRSFTVEAEEQPEHPEFASVEEDMVVTRHAVASYVIPNNTFIDKQWALKRIGFYPAWAEQDGVAGVVVAVIDEGLHVTHPEFTDRGITGFNSTGAPAWDAPAGNHGTMVASCISTATDTGTGMASPASGCTLMPIQMILTVSAIVEAMSIAEAQGAHVMNLSLGVSTPSATFTAAVESAFDAGIVVIMSAGNNGATTGAVEHPIVPGKCFKVGSLNTEDLVADHSSWGEAVDIAAPGESIYVATGTNNAYTTVYGTSFAAPYVAAVAALVLSEYSALTPTEVFDILKSTSTATVGSSTATYFPNSSGCVDALRAVLKARSMNPANAGTAYPYVLFDKSSTVETFSDGVFSIDITEEPPLADVGAYGGKAALTQNQQYVYMGPEHKRGRNILCNNKKSVLGTYSTA